MDPDPKQTTNGIELDINHYLDAAADASKRTRTVIITLVVASVLSFAGFLNSIDQNWMLARVRATSSPNSVYFKKKFPQLEENSDEAKQGHSMFYDALMKAYVNNTFTIHVPFFGISFDVNDLGLLSGVAFLILLLLFRFCLARELDNLRVGFQKADREGRLDTFYLLLAMRQVLSMPRTDWPIGRRASGNRKKPGLIVRVVPKSLAWLPVIVLAVVIAHDLLTFPYGNAVSTNHTLVLYIVSIALFTLSCTVTWSAIAVWREIDDCWERCWEEVDVQQNQGKLRVMPSQSGEASPPAVNPAGA